MDRSLPALFTHLISPEEEIEFSRFRIHWQATDKQSSDLKQNILLYYFTQTAVTFTFITEVLQFSVCCSKRQETKERAYLTLIGSTVYCGHTSQKTDCMN